MVLPPPNSHRTNLWPSSCFNRILNLIVTFRDKIFGRIFCWSFQGITTNSVTTLFLWSSQRIFFVESCHHMTFVGPPSRVASIFNLLTSKSSPMSSCFSPLRHACHCKILRVFPESKVPSYPFFGFFNRFEDGL